MSAVAERLAPTASRVSIVPARAAHIARMLSTIRAADRAELWAGWHQTPEQALRAGLQNSSHAWTAFVDMEPMCMAGIVPASLLGGIGVPWMVGTVALEQHQLAFLRKSKAHVERMQRLYSSLSNYVAAENVLAVRWLTWLRFTVHPAMPFGPDSALFHRFDWKAPHV